MSVSQFATAVNRQPSAGNSGSIYYHIVYDFPSLFHQQFPNARAQCVGLIPDWELHFNQKGRGNIRPRFDTKLAGFEPIGKEYLMPIPAHKEKRFNTKPSFPVCGIVFAVSKHDDGVIEKRYATQNRSRVLCKAWVPQHPGGPINPKRLLAVSAYADLHYTRHGRNPVPSMCEVERKRWVDTLNIFDRSDVPKVLQVSIRNLLTAQTTSKFTPIYVDPEAYPLQCTRFLEMQKEKRDTGAAAKAVLPLQAANPQKKASTYGDVLPSTVPVKDTQTRTFVNRHGEKVRNHYENGYEHPLPTEAASLQETYYQKHGVLAPACPVNDQQAKIFEDYHDEVMRSQVDFDFDDPKHLQTSVSNWKLIADRCDDGLDVYDVVRKSQGRRPWKHPNDVSVTDEDEDEEIVVAQEKSASNVVKKRPANPTSKANTVNNKAPTTAKQNPSSTVVNKKQRTQKSQVSPLTGQPPAKKQKVQQTSPASPARAPKGPQNQTLANVVSDAIQENRQQGPTK